MEEDDEFGDLYADVLQPFNAEPIHRQQPPHAHRDIKFDIEDAAQEASRTIGQGHDWDDSDESEDDLQIVLDDNSLTPPAPGQDGAVDIAADAEEQDWGGNSVDVGESAKALAPKVGYSNQGYLHHHHPFHSQFKYVRPGAAPIPAATSSTPGGPPGQIRPLDNMISVAGHGRGDWRPTGIKGAASMPKGFQAGPGLPIWGNNAAGRGFGGGLEFTLPSHKTIFDVGIGSFEEKPWKYPGVDVSEFFNFGLNEDTWKDYCKQLEQLRLESTLQSKIHVYESGRTEQDYDPDLPPELAAASGIHDVPVDNANSVKLDVGQKDLIKGSGPMRAPVPTGRAIQVESGSGDRLPSIDTRPPRIRDSDAIIEIVLQDPVEDDSCTRIDVQDQQDGIEHQSEDFSEDHVVGHEITRQVLGRVCDQSPCVTCSQEMTIVDSKKEDSVESMEDRHCVHLSSPAIENVEESSIGNKQLEETGTADGSSKSEKEDIDLNTVDNRDTVKDEIAERQKVTSLLEQHLLGDGSDWEDSKAVRSSDNSKAKSESSRDYHKQWAGLEVVQDPRSVHLGSIRPQPEENEQVFHRREHDEKQKAEKNGKVIKSREDPYPYKDRQPSLAHQSHTKIDGFDCQRDRVGSDMDWARRDDDLYGRRIKNDGLRKRDRGSVRENERSDNDDSFHSRKQLDNGSYRVPYDKDVRSRVPRHKERDDSLKDKHEAVEYFHSKRRKNEEYLRREHVGKEVLHGYRENVSWHKPERDSAFDPRTRDDHQRSRENLDDQYAVKQKNVAQLLRERGNRKRDREEWRRVKQPHKEHPSTRERGGRSSVRNGPGDEENTLIGHVRAKHEHKVSQKEYQSREATLPSDQLKRKGRNKGESPHCKVHDDAYVRGNQYSSEERQSRKEKSGRRGDRATNSLDSQRVHERKCDESTRKSKEPIVGSLGSLGTSNRSPKDQSGEINDKYCGSRIMKS
ncbi:FIP1[V]-like protein isoform X2 [Cajanus cajan]|uniref:FIP1[V]-like protein isoform X2 n=1 Tax=Cajanus cajan TaxID=3821 RepID=UPI00098D8753|nr:FIP1[V]-like protein isoform X2 [Cajanus cajan]